MVQLLLTLLAFLQPLAASGLATMAHPSAHRCASTHTLYLPNPA